MAVLDAKRKVIKGKIVYYGPGLCGKTTNLEYINSAMKGSQEMMSLATEGDRTIFFDFLPMDLGKIRGISTTFKLYTVPGQVRYNLTRKMVLKNVDGVVFVADSQLNMMDSNIESLENLFDNLRELGMNPDEIPIVLQYNKRDLSNLASPEDLDSALNSNDYPVYLASAVTGEGVLDTLKKITNIVFEKISATFEGKSKPAARKRASVPPQPPRETPPSQEPQAAEVKETDAGQVVYTDTRTQPQLFPPPGPKPSKVSARKMPRVVVGEAPREDREEPTVKPEVVVDVATRKDIGDLRGEIATLIKQKDMALYTQKKVTEAAEKQNREFQHSVSEDISVIREEIAKYRKEFDDLRNAITGLEGQIKAAPRSGSAPDDLQKDNARLLKQISKGQVTKEEVSALQQTVSNLAEQTHAILATQKVISAQDKNLASVLKRVEAQTEELQRSTSQAISGIREEIAKQKKAVPVPMPERAPSREEDLEKDPRHKNASRVARVMVADLSLYHPDDVTVGIINGDLDERLKVQLEDMRKTYETRIPEEIRAEKDYLAEAIEDFVAGRRKDLGIG